jgi:hypothetical protein
MEIVYAAHTKSGVFMLDENGVCRWAVAQPGHAGREEKVPERIVGAQYLATLDVHAEGAIVDFPRVGCPMLFAATDETGRVRLVRTPPLTRFEDRRVAPMRRPLASKFDDDEKTPVALARTSSVPPPPPPSDPAPQTDPEPSLPLPLTNAISTRTPLPPPPRARIAARIPPPPSIPSLAQTSGSGLRVTPTPNVGVQSIPVRFHAANMSLRKLARGK